jgi:hypothetical protein
MHHQGVRRYGVMLFESPVAQDGLAKLPRNPVWSKISNALKRLGFRYRNFLAQLLSETSKACTIRVRRLSLGSLRLFARHVGLHSLPFCPGQEFLPVDIHNRFERLRSLLDHHKSFAAHRLPRLPSQHFFFRRLF